MCRELVDRPHPAQVAKNLAGVERHEVGFSELLGFHVGDCLGGQGARSYQRETVVPSRSGSSGGGDDAVEVVAQFLAVADLLEADA